MGATLDETRVELAAQRAKVRGTADRLEAATRRALNVKAKVRGNPVKTVALVAGLGYVLLGGPRKTIRQLRRAIGGPPSGARAYAALPDPLRSLIDDWAPGRGTEREEARNQLAVALHAWREDPKNRKRANRLVSETLTPPGPERAFWALVEVVALTAAGIIGRQVVARRLTQELLSSRPPAAAASSGAPAQYSGWSGQRRGPAGPGGDVGGASVKPATDPAKPTAGRS